MKKVKNFFKINIYFYYFIFFFFSLFVFNVLLVNEEYYISIGLFLFIYLIIYFLFYEINNFLIDALFSMELIYMDILKVNYELRLELLDYFLEEHYTWEYISKVLLIIYTLRKQIINDNLFYIKFFYLYHTIVYNYTLSIFFYNLKFYLDIYLKNILKLVPTLFYLDYKLKFIYFFIFKDKFSSFYFFNNNFIYFFIKLVIIIGGDINRNFFEKK